MSLTKFHPTPRAQVTFRTISEEQLSQLLALLAEDPKLRDLHDVVAIVSGTGIRARELKELRWTDVDFNRREIVITSSASPTRTVPIGDDAFRAFESQRQRQTNAEHVLGTSPDKLFLCVIRKLATVSLGADKGRISIQVLRHTFFTRLMNSGASISTLASVMGSRIHFRSLEKLNVRAAPLVHE